MAVADYRSPARLARRLYGASHARYDTSGTYPAPVAGDNLDVWFNGDAGTGPLEIWVNDTGTWVNIGRAGGDAGAIWSTFDPQMTSTAGAFTSITTLGNYKMLNNNTCAVNMFGFITTNGTASTSILFQLPFPAYAQTALAGSCGLKSLNALAAGAHSTEVSVYNYDGTYPGGDGKFLSVSGVYQTI